MLFRRHTSGAWQAIKCLVNKNNLPNRRLSCVCVFFYFLSMEVEEGPGKQCPKSNKISEWIEVDVGPLGIKRRAGEEELLDRPCQMRFEQSLDCVRSEHRTPVLIAQLLGYWPVWNNGTLAAGRSHRRRRRRRRRIFPMMNRAGPRPLPVPAGLSASSGFNQRRPIGYMEILSLRLCRRRRRFDRRPQPLHHSRLRPPSVSVASDGVSSLGPVAPINSMPLVSFFPPTRAN